MNIPGASVSGSALRYFRALRDPALEHREFFRGDLLALLRHLAIADQAHQLARLRLPRHQHVAAILERLIHEAPQPQIHAALRLFLLAVAVRAVRLQDRPHVAFKSQRGRLRICLAGHWAGQNRGKEQGSGKKGKHAEWSDGRGGRGNNRSTQSSLDRAAQTRLPSPAARRNCGQCEDSAMTRSIERLSRQIRGNRGCTASGAVRIRSAFFRCSRLLTEQPPPDDDPPL